MNEKQQSNGSRGEVRDAARQQPTDAEKTGLGLAVLPWIAFALTLVISPG